MCLFRYGCFMVRCEGAHLGMLFCVISTHSSGAVRIWVCLELPDYCGWLCTSSLSMTWKIAMENEVFFRLGPEKPKSTVTLGPKSLLLTLGNKVLWHLGRNCPMLLVGKFAKFDEERLQTWGKVSKRSKVTSYNFTGATCRA